MLVVGTETEILEVVMEMEILGASSKKKLEISSMDMETLVLVMELLGALESLMVLEAHLRSLGYPAMVQESTTLDTIQEAMDTMQEVLDTMVGGVVKHCSSIAASTTSEEDHFTTSSLNANVLNVTSRPHSMGTGIMETSMVLEGQTTITMETSMDREMQMRQQTMFCIYTCLSLLFTFTNVISISEKLTTNYLCHVIPIYILLKKGAKIQ